MWIRLKIILATTQQSESRASSDIIFYEKLHLLNSLIILGHIEQAIDV